MAWDEVVVVAVVVVVVVAVVVVVLFLRFVLLSCTRPCNHGDVFKQQ